MSQLLVTQDSNDFVNKSLAITFVTLLFRDVAQPGSAHVWGACGRKFESCRPDNVVL